jgi:hypothetical protein
MGVGQCGPWSSLSEMATPQSMSTTFFRFPTGTQLSVLESAILHARWAWSGLVDANRWLRVLSAIFECVLRASSDVQEETEDEMNLKGRRASRQRAAVCARQ